MVANPLYKTQRPTFLTQNPRIKIVPCPLTRSCLLQQGLIITVCFSSLLFLFMHATRVTQCHFPLLLIYDLVVSSLPNPRQLCVAGESRTKKKTQDIRVLIIDILSWIRAYIESHSSKIKIPPTFLRR